jgi:hypothetical protein
MTLRCRLAANPYRNCTCTQSSTRIWSPPTTVSSADRHWYANPPPGWPEGHRESDESDEVDLGEHDNSPARKTLTLLVSVRLALRHDATGRSAARVTWASIGKKITGKIAKALFDPA